MNVASVMVALALGTVACGTNGGHDDPTSAISGEIVVFAAASLADAFDELGRAFVAAHPGISIVFNYAGSQRLASQINDGAPVDVFASANVAQMDVVEAAENVAETSHIFTTNVLAIAVEPGNPLGITALADLGNPDVVLVLPAEEVPAGHYARAVLEDAGVAVAPVSLEIDVRAALAKVELGEADASIVYASDIVASGGRAEGIAIPIENNVAANYPIAVLAHAPNRSAATAFVAFVLNDVGQAILSDYGFVSP